MALGSLIVELVRQLSLARRERDLAIELLCQAQRTIGDLENDRYRERRLQQEHDRAMFLLAQDHERRTVDAMETAA